MNNLQPIVSELKKLKVQQNRTPQVRWAVIHSVSPLRIRLDEDVLPLAGTPQTLVNPELLEVGMRVEVLFQNNRAIIQGIGGGSPAAGGAPEAILYFTANDSFEKADYPNIRAIRVRVQGAGGGGGSAAAASSGQSSAGQGGGGGGYAESFITDLDSLPGSVPITVGAGGVPGGTGGTSSFGTITVATGGGGGWAKPNSPYAMYVPGGPPGVGTAGDLLISGGGGGCGSAHGTLCASGAGGSSQLGGGGRSRGTGGGSSGEPGDNGGLYGGGGSGGSANAGSSARTGGTGAPGIVILELYR